MTRPPGTPGPAALLNQLSLWPHQRRAIAVARRYVAAFRARKTRGSGLVHMATGTGKTGIIAALARCVPEVGCVLVLAPRIALRDHLLNDIDDRFFKSLERKPRNLPKTVSTIDKLLERSADPALDDVVLVSTIQLIDRMAKAQLATSALERRKHRLYTRLIKNVQLVLIDEGHYEPALSWSNAVRRFAAPRILFTATPYRNDLKAFDVDPDYTSHFTFKEASDQHFIRHVTVVSRRPLRDPRSFAADVLEFYETQVKNRWPDARVIVRCDTHTAITQMAQVLDEHGQSVVAIHERFTGETGASWERRHVPRRDREPEYYAGDGPTFWIHQFKLLEGIDDNRFRLVALFQRLKNRSSGKVVLPI